jgi:hypothetical protein
MKNVDEIIPNFKVNIEPECFNETKRLFHCIKNETEIKNCNPVELNSCLFEKYKKNGKLSSNNYLANDLMENNIDYMDIKNHYKNFCWDSELLFK